MENELLSAAAFAALLGVFAALLEFSASRAEDDLAPDGGEVPWPHGDLVGFRRVMAAALLGLAGLVLAAEAARSLWLGG